MSSGPCEDGERERGEREVGRACLSLLRSLPRFQLHRVAHGPPYPWKPHGNGNRSWIRECFQQEFGEQQRGRWIVANMPHLRNPSPACGWIMWSSSISGEEMGCTCTGTGLELLVPND